MFLSSILVGISILLKLSFVSALPNDLPTLQFCKSDVSFPAPFCMGVTSYFNFTEDPAKHDLYITLEIARAHDWPKGWTAIGLGDGMAGALMFIVYGDPKSSAAPTVSIRTSSGHTAPQPVIFEPTVDQFDPKPDVRVTYAAWDSRTDLPWDDGSIPALARINLICHSCDRWSHTSVDMKEKAQPWIWASNIDMDFHGDFSVDRELTRHAPRTGSGIFYADMSAILKAESIAGGSLAARLPVIDWHVPRKFSSENRHELIGDGAADDQAPWDGNAEKKAIIRERAIIVHGILCIAAFWLILPLGALAIRVELQWLHRYWVHVGLQVLGALLAVAGGLLGLGLDGWAGFHHPHQFIGCVLLVLLSLQVCTGAFQRFGFWDVIQKQRLRNMHDWNARVLLLGGWGNVILGLIFAGAPTIYVWLSYVIAGAWASGLTVAWVRWKLRNLRVIEAQDGAGDADEAKYHALGDVDIDL